MTEILKSPTARRRSRALTAWLVVAGWSQVSCSGGDDAAVGRDDAQQTASDDDDADEPKKSRDEDPTSEDAGKRTDAGKRSTPSTGSEGAEIPSASDGAEGGAATASDSLWCKAKAVLDKRCTSCHDGEGTAGAPMGLTTFADTQAAAKTDSSKKNYQLVGTRIRDTKRPMPPANDMTEAEKKTLEAWITAGAKAGASETCGGSTTPARPATAEWPEGCTEKNRYKLTAGGARIARGTETHPQVFLDAPWGSEPVQALAMRSITDNKKVLHHWILYASTGAFVTGWAPGKEDGQPLPADVGMYLPSGPRSLRLDMHYFNREGTKDEVDSSGVEICAVPRAQWRKNTATVFMGFASMGQGFVLAPAGKMGHESTGTCRVTARQPVHLMTASPHAHQYAKAMRFTVTKANGQKITLHEGPFNFEEQSAYSLKEEVILNSGDTVTTTCIYDNPTNKSITFGENTGNEMCFNFALYYPMGALSCGF